MKHALICLCLIACSPEPEPEPPLSPEALLETLRAPGPFRVGYRESRVQTTDLYGEPRELRLAVWYPTDASTGPEVLYQGFFPAPGVLSEPEPAAGPFPLVVFSHGHQGYAESSGQILAHLASHGIVVAAPDHTGNTAFDPSERDASIYLQRPADLIAVMDEVLDKDPLSSILSGEVVAMGHSFGGYTIHGLLGARYDVEELAAPCEDQSNTGLFCETLDETVLAAATAGYDDPRPVAALAMAPGDWRLFQSGLAELSVPELLMTGGLDGATESQGKPIFADLDDPGDLWLHMPQVAHTGFTDVAGKLFPDPAELPAEEGWEIMHTYALAWVRASLGDEAMAPLLSLDVSFTDEVVMREE